MGEIAPILQPNGFGPKSRFNLTPNLAPLGGVFYGKSSKRYFGAEWHFWCFLGVFGKRAIFDHFGGFRGICIKSYVKYWKIYEKMCKISVIFTQNLHKNFT